MWIGIGIAILIIVVFAIGVIWFYKKRSKENTVKKSK